MARKPSLARWCSLSLAALIAACGGGGGGSSPANPANPASVAIAFAGPEAETVHSVGSPLSLSARVTVNGADAADGTPVNFAASPGTFSATGTTRSGVATVAFSGTVPGRQQLSASVAVPSGSSATATAKATRIMYLRPVPASLEVLVPAYFHPSSGTEWARLAAGAAAHPGVAVTAIMNPNNGEFTSAEAAYTNALGTFVAAGGKVVGYVYTGYGARSLAAVKANIDAYFALYGRAAISGIFLDEMSSDAAKLSGYREIYAYIKAKGADLRVIGNPGRVPDTADYATVADVLVTFEDRNSTYAAYDPRTTPWLYTLPNNRQSSLVHDTATCVDMVKALQSAGSPIYNAGLVYMTDLQYDPVRNIGNPWASLPSYWTALLQTVAAMNQGRPPPAC
ncbi:spherulation-specific family 4 protein [Paracidovorax citrulli]|uniref:Spherulation-specific family 4 n=2 Tax=Paracidovorax citrulli TaxID=80869 RepID=A1TKZ4_PARC0|nr:spherulation-specific family 4 protein [Paracidovorax citrulli]ABM31632.1 hypothetical protein Aave_1035 [Paracidovorax citrulli AAC00-1]ATG95281.1 hypothetical protein CQB05_15665 [Paracidovorax citrulli]MVT38207.1 hypothetical protein [Paracidovorax citrulli]PVY65820.1 spherulation-specific family 4 protein [Paracidovorax citrulli]QCX11552.1 hypothetical protein APS58_2744 [Paracidovorax citrulli]